MVTLQKIALALTIIGALNWGLVGIFDFNLVSAIFGAMDTSIITRIVYALVGIAGIINIGLLIQDIEFK
ncbi:MAG TPA: DUF378 domain-containing protein [Bacilli bacterium]|nr:DUF378 domain-containing protein [Bacilli bacterium]